MTLKNDIPQFRSLTNGFLCTNSFLVNSVTYTNPRQMQSLHGRIIYELITVKILAILLPDTTLPLVN